MADENKSAHEAPTPMTREGVSIVYTPGGLQRLSTISKSGLFQLVSTSPLPKAKDFRRWVTALSCPHFAKLDDYQWA